MKIACLVNHQSVELETRADEMLLEVLRRELHLTSVRATCGVGICGACTALINGEPISTCILLAPLAQGCEILTIEGLDSQHHVQQAFEEEHAFQCGYCTPAMILTCKALLEENPHPTDAEVKEALGGNLCRCGCYVKILKAVKRAAHAQESLCTG
jgi:aerobic-type carbon monoxide dehydrogenase small subunit (CoxS/CutS family)